MNDRVIDDIDAITRRSLIIKIAIEIVVKTGCD